MKPKHTVNIKTIMQAAQPSSTLNICELSQQCIKMEITSLKRKNIYKIGIDGSPQKLKKALDLIQTYSHKKITLNKQNIQIYKQWFLNISFEEIHIFQYFSQQQLFNIFACKPKKVVFSLNLSSLQISQIIFRMHKQAIYRQISIQFHREHTNWEQIVQFLKNWITDDDENATTFQKITFVNMNKQMLSTFQKKETYGLFVYLTNFDQKNHNVSSILQIFRRCNKKISVQFCFWKPCFIEAIKYVLVNFSHYQNYLIKFSNFVEITNCQFSLNTTDLQKNEVDQIFQLLKSPGHYDLVFHSSQQYFEQIVLLFLEKPIIKFKCLLHYSEFNNLKEPIQAMQRKAEDLGQRVKKWMKILNQDKKINFNLALRLYKALPRNNR